MRIDQEHKQCEVRQIQTKKTRKRYYHQVCLSNNWGFVPFFSFILSVVNALSDKAVENDIRLGGGERFLDMQLQERQYKHVIVVNSYQFMQVLFHIHGMPFCNGGCERAPLKIHKRRCVTPILEQHTTNHINN